MLGQEATTSALKSSITPEYLAPIFTFIVGLLGIIGQISVSYFTEKSMEIVQKKYIRGYECDAIEQLLVAEITKTSGSKYLVSSKKAGTF